MHLKVMKNDSVVLILNNNNDLTPIVWDLNLASVSLILLNNIILNNPTAHASYSSIHYYSW